MYLNIEEKRSEKNQRESCGKFPSLFSCGVAKKQKGIKRRKQQNRQICKNKGESHVPVTIHVSLLLYKWRLPTLLFAYSLEAWKKKKD
ncbi:hypothetical protein HQ43_05505 [Porphyromonas canoris]|uniref:Uncharacterized protein n=1 Tax=Porphyromonas canoris TaxID=36875 RepID=A0ABR4XKU9_9PORP|nr:hypothetical protein HQ43_05505 [Porphyromonas canoris]